ncbi:hypothetical protein [Symbiopectobacterium purcellii]|uniref:hypothetical protein n=1 Tax=Symbiopectobacterium purcellii TaxID=2871826 RepID=UPI003F85D3E0
MASNKDTYVDFLETAVKAAAQINIPLIAISYIDGSNNITQPALAMIDSVRNHVPDTKFTSVDIEDTRSEIISLIKKNISLPRKTGFQTEVKM